MRITSAPPRRSLRLLCALTLAGAGPLVAQDTSSQREFTVRSAAGDTIAVERFVRTDSTVAGFIRGLDGRRIGYRASLESGGWVLRMHMDTDGIEDPYTGVATFRDERAIVGWSGAAWHWSAEGRTASRSWPSMAPDVSIALLEQLLRATPLSPGESVAVATFGMHAGDTATILLHRTDPDSVTITVPEGDLRLALGSNGSILGGELADLGWEIEHSGGPSELLRAPTCAGPPPVPSSLVAVGGHPVQALPTRDGCWIFVSLAGSDTGWPGAIALLRIESGDAKLVRTLPVPGLPFGLLLADEERTLVVAAGDRIVFVDADRLIGGNAEAVSGSFVDPRHSGKIVAALTADGRFLFTSDEGAATITVVDMERGRASGFAPSSVVGRIPVGRAPVALVFSPDERLLYTTSQIAPAELGWPMNCVAERADIAADAPDRPHGAIFTIDVERARSEPERAVLTATPAGCNPVRLALSADGSRAYVTARGDHAVLAFDTDRLVSDPGGALLGSVPVGPAPVGVALLDGDSRVVVTNSNRFEGDNHDSSFLSVIDAHRTHEGAAAVVGTIPVGAFPRELRVTPDGSTLLVTNFSSGTLQLIDLARLPLEPR